MAYYRGIVSATKAIGTEGLGVAGGFIAGGVLGRQVENMVMKGNPVTPTSTLKEKVKGYLANNAPKVLAYVVARKYDAHTETTRDAAKALLGSVAYDTILRLANKGYNPADISIGGYRVLGDNTQQLVQENSILRGELNKALAQLAGPDSSYDFRYGGAPSPAVAERQRKFGAMPLTPDVMERQRRFGAMPFEQNPDKTSRERRYGFMTYPTDTSVGATFAMQ